MLNMPPSVKPKRGAAWDVKAKYMDNSVGALHIPIGRSGVCGIILLTHKA
jgi:hypothetical protein